VIFGRDDGRARRRRRDASHRSNSLVVRTIAIAIAIASTALVLAAASYFEARDSHWIANVDGSLVTRADLRNRMALIESLKRLARDRTARSDPAQVAAVQAYFSADTLTVARSQLVDEILLRGQAAAVHLLVPEPNVVDELARTINEPASRRVRWVSVKVGSHSKTEVDASVRMLTDLMSKDSIRADLRSVLDPSWLLDVGDAWLNTSGSEALGPGLPPPLVILRSRLAGEGTVLGPYDDGLGNVTVARVAIVALGATIGPSLLDAVESDGVSKPAIDVWAAAQVLRRTVATALLDGWRANGGDQVRLAELVLGAAGGGPPMVDLEALVVARVTSTDPTGFAISLQAELAALSPVQRRARFDGLVAQANAWSPSDQLTKSGEIGWVAHDDVIPELASDVFGSIRQNGDIVGPIDTVAGPELFLLEARSDLALDERAAAIDIEARQPNADLAAIAKRVAPSDACRAGTGPWRALASFPATEIKTAGLASVAVDDLIGPLAIDAQMVTGRVLERRSGPYTDDELASLELEGFSTWLGDRELQATIVLDPDPLGLGSPTTPASLAPSGDGGRTTFFPGEVPKSLPPFGLPTPDMPAIPTLP
jgi:hypothetical protein